MPSQKPLILDGEPVVIDRTFITQARRRAQNEAWAWRYESHTPRNGWRQHAKCFGLDVNLFYGSEGTTTKIPSAVNRICDGCPVRTDCGAQASIEEPMLDLNVIHGVRAGLAATTRLKMYKHLTRLGIREYR